ncbi:hypothetical protein HYX16_06430 [Candidatus Woesearchaeota archaeon]|nr:hypothetical protein [Candidatus Woesearchaeota archaeon]
MPEIYQFPIRKAEAIIKDGRMTVRLFYPADTKPQKRLPENPKFGVSVFEDLVKEGFAAIADEQNPIGPCGGGSLYILKDDVIVCHRRDSKAPGHAMYHSAYSGWPDSEKAIFTADGLVDICLRETAEECLLVTRDPKPWLLVPKDSQEYTHASAKRLGIDLRERLVDVELVPPTDTLEVYDHNCNQIFTAKAFLRFIYESNTSLNASQIRQLPLSSDEVVPIDAEGMISKDGKFIHFNRESYFVSLDEIAKMQFGSIMGLQGQGVRVFKTMARDGIPEVYTPEYREPFLGPDNVPVIHPHIWAPEDSLTRALDGLGIPGYKGKWMEIELWKERSKLEGKSLLPDGVIKK